ncbi:TPA: fimbria/pilus outer membrane usher protein [Serratia liquefaciens]
MKKTMNGTPLRAAGHDHDAVAAGICRRTVGLPPRLAPLSLAVALTLGGSGQALARDYFDPSLLDLGNGKGAAQADLSQFETAGGQAAGSYRVDVYVNGEYARTQDMRFVRDAAGKLQPSLTPEQLGELGVNTASSPALMHLPVAAALPSPLETYIPQAKSTLDFQQMRLNMSVPQLNMKPILDRDMDESKLDEGMPALMLNYMLSGSTNQRNRDGNDSDSQNLFGSFQSGLNVGAWRLRNSSTYSYNQQRYDQYDSLENARRRTSQSDSRWSTQQTYVQRDIIPLRSQLTMGETSTGAVASQMLDGFSYRGVSMASDESMMPGSMTGFAPEITGMAKSNAVVTITQNGMVIYQTNVAPGPFRIADLAGGSNGGDLVVSVRESDGSTHGFVQPYTSLPIMLRPGQVRYEVAGGQYYQGHGSYNSRRPNFVMGSAIYGANNNMTVYGGSIMSDKYQSVAAGTGFGLWGLGALSLDATHSHAKLEHTDETMSGESYRARFSKSVLSSGTSVDLTAYRYSTRNFLSFQEANTQGYETDDRLPAWLNGRRKSSFEMRLSQRVLDSLSLTLSGRRDNYWGTDRTNTNLMAGVNGSVSGVGWGINYGVDRIRGDGDWPVNRQVSFNLNVPMSLFGAAGALQNSYAGYAFAHDSTGRSTNRLSAGGSFLDDNSLNWSAGTYQANQGEGNSGDVSMGYNGNYGQATLGYNYDRGGRGVTYGASGGVMAHPYGVTLAQRTGDASVLVRTPGVSGVKVMNDSRVKTDYFGNAVVNASQYRRNTINIDPASLPEGADLGQTSQSLYPTAGAVVKAEYKVRTGQQLLMNLLFRGKPVPFGAMVGLLGDPDNNQASIVGEDGQVYLSGMPQQGTLQVKWGQASDSQCRVSFSLPAPQTRPASDTTWQPMKTLNATCL